MLKVGLSGFERSGAPGLREIWRGGAISRQLGQLGEQRRWAGRRFWRVSRFGTLFFESVRRRRPAPEQREASPPPTPRSRSLGLAGRSWSVWVWVGSHTNWTGVVGCACEIYASAKARRPQTYVPPYLTIFAFGSDHFGSTSGAFGQLGEQGRWAGSRFWQVWRSDRVFSSVRAARGAGQVVWHSGLVGSVL